MDGQGGQRRGHSMSQMGHECRFATFSECPVTHPSRLRKRPQKFYARKNSPAMSAMHTTSTDSGLAMKFRSVPKAAITAVYIKPASSRLHAFITIHYSQIHFAFALPFFYRSGVFGRPITGKCCGVVFELDD